MDIIKNIDYLKSKNYKKNTIIKEYIIPKYIYLFYS